MSVLDRVRGRARTDDDYRDDDHVVEREPVGDPTVVRDRQREEFGGTNWGAAFFGWLVAIGLGALLTALVAAAGTAIALSEFDVSGTDADEIGLGGAIALFVIGLIAYFAGGYVAGRMSRFDGGRQGVAVWIWGIVAVVILAVIGAIVGDEYNVFADLDLPRIPIDEGDLTTGGIVTLIVIAVGTLVAAMAGGKAGERYHRRVDRAGWHDRRPLARDADDRYDRTAPTS